MATAAADFVAVNREKLARKKVEPAERKKPGDYSGRPSASAVAAATAAKYASRPIAGVRR